MIEQLWCRWAWNADGASFDAIGERDESGSLRTQHRGLLAQEAEYILFLQGGEVWGAPIAPEGLLRIRPDGTAEEP